MEALQNELIEMKKNGVDESTRIEEASQKQRQEVS